MAGAFSTYLGDALLDHVLRGVDYTPPTDVYVSLHDAAPGRTGANEITGYTGDRKLASFAAASGRTSSTDTNLDYEGMPSTTVTHYGVWDAATGGNFLYGGPADSSTSVNAGETFRLPAGELTVEHD